MITGLGAVTPLGSDLSSTWAAVRAGQTAGEWLSWTDPTGRRPGARWIVAPARPSVVAAGPEVSVAPTSRSGDDAGTAANGGDGWASSLSDSACRAAVAAWDDADAAGPHSLAAIAPDRRGCFFGTSKGNLHAAGLLHARAAGRVGPSLCDPALEPPLDAALWPAVWPSAAAIEVAARLACLGPCLAPVAACATGLVALVRGCLALHCGECDVAVVGSADDSLHPVVLASFQRLGVLARGTDPQTASRPFDRQRTGFVVGAGAGALILERRRDALARGARWHAVIERTAWGSDPTGLTTLDPTGAGLERLLQDALAGGVVPDAIQLHGTGTRLNDPAECRALLSVLGKPGATIPAWSAKGGLGHLLGAAGSVETVLACRALTDQWVPGNANLTDLDAACGLQFTRGAGEPRRLERILKLSLGFGGHQAAVLLGRGTRFPNSARD